MYPHTCLSFHIHALPFVTVDKLSLYVRHWLPPLPSPALLVSPSTGSFLTTCKCLTSSQLGKKPFDNSLQPLPHFSLFADFLFSHSFECAPIRPSFLPLHWNSSTSNDLHFAKFSYQYSLSYLQSLVCSSQVSSSVPQSNPSMAGWELCSFGRVLGCLWQPSLREQTERCSYVAFPKLVQ